MQPGLLGQGLGRIHPGSGGHQPGGIESRRFIWLQQLADRFNGEAEARAGRLVRLCAEATHQGVVTAAAGNRHRGIQTLAHQPEDQAVVEVEVGLEARIELKPHATLGG